MDETKNTQNAEYEKVYDHYVKQADTFAHSWESTMQDRLIRETEIESLVRIIKLIHSENNPKREIRILEVGCGNGYVSARLLCEFPNLIIEALDVNSELISTANERNLPKCEFKVLDIADENADQFLSEEYDFVFSVRCLINIEEAESQLRAIKTMGSKLAPKGYLALLEGFISGQDKYNDIRNAFGYNQIPPAWHNWYLDLTKIDDMTAPKGFLRRLENPLEEIGVDSHHLSSHYLATRVWQPLLHNDQNHYMNHRNDAIGQAVSKILPRTEDFSPLQIHIWKRETS